jgi:hypothetical protein
MFETAWSGVPGLMREMSARFPDLSFKYSFADEDWGNVEIFFRLRRKNRYALSRAFGSLPGFADDIGEFEFEGGECTMQHVPADQSADAREIAGELLGYPEREDEYGDENSDEWGDEP